MLEGILLKTADMISELFMNDVFVAAISVFVAVNLLWYTGYLLYTNATLFTIEDRNGNIKEYGIRGLNQSYRGR